MRIAVVGCGHGELDKMYDVIKFMEAKDGIKVELLLCCGDFQSVRNYDDLAQLACPPKYRKLNTFYKYYSGEARAPVLTIFVGGNHEASNYLLELFHGGWVAPNIYYMGWSGVVNYGGLRIAGLSGIFKGHHFKLGHFECPPFDNSDMRSVYHVREYDVFKLLQVQRPIDIFLSHDWPQGIYHEGDTAGLIRRKKFLADEIKDNSLGNPAGRKLLNILKPRFWFSAHLHVKFAGLVRHPPTEDGKGRATRFLALDKCLPNKDYMQVLDFPEATGEVGNRQFCYDEEWLAIMRSTNNLLSLDKSMVILPTPQTHERFDYRPEEEEMTFVKDAFARAAAAREESSSDSGLDTDHDPSPLEIPRNFCPTAPAHDDRQGKTRAKPVRFVVNPQTTELLNTLNIRDHIAEKFGPKANGKPAKKVGDGCNPDEIDLGDL